MFDTEATVAFGVVMSIWGSFFVDFWKRRQATLAYDWEVLELDGDEPDRPEFIGTEEAEDEVTGEVIMVRSFQPDSL